jgi:hypothetical protein
VRRRRPPLCCRPPLARALAALRRDLERVEASPDLVGRVRRAIRAHRRRASPGRLVAVAVLAVLSLVAGAGPLDATRALSGATAASFGTPPTAVGDPGDVGLADLLLRLGAPSARTRREALAESASLLPRPPHAVRAAWRALLADPDPGVAALADALLRAAAPTAEASR